MPYNTTMGYRRSGNRRRYPRRKRYVKKSLGGRVKKIVDGTAGGYVKAGIQAMPYVLNSLKMLKGLVNSEYKYIDQNGVSVTFGTGNISYLSDIAQGTGDEERIGNTILIKDILFRFQLVQSASATNTICRIILFVDKQTDGAAPTVANVLQNPSSGTVQISPLNQDFTKRFVIIRDWMVPLSTGGATCFSDKYYKVLNFHTRFDGVSSSITDAKENQIFMLCACNETVNFPTITFDSRIKFHDS